MRPCLLLLVAAAAVASAQPGHPDRAVFAEAGGPYLLGIGAAYEARLGGPLAVRGTVGVRDVEVLGNGGGHAATGAAVSVLAGGRWVEVEAAAGLMAALSQRRVYRDGQFLPRGPGLVPHAEGGVRFSIPVGQTPDGRRRLHRDLVLRAGLAVVYDRQDFDPDDGVGHGPAVFAVPVWGAGLAF